MQLNKPYIIGHRGACGYAPENTLASFRAAQALNVKWVEFDVMLAKCGEAIVIHDTTINRTTNGSGNVIDYSWQQLQIFNAGHWFTPHFDEKLPRFEDVMHFLQQHNMSAVIEMKPYPGFEIQTAETIFKLLPQFNSCEKIVSSFSPIALQQARKLCADTHLGLGVHHWENDWEKIAKELRCHSLHVNHNILTPEKIATIKTKGYSVFSYTVNEFKRAKELFSWGIDAIFSDYPDKFNDLI